MTFQDTKKVARKKPRKVHLWETHKRRPHCGVINDHALYCGSRRRVTCRNCRPALRRKS